MTERLYLADSYLLEFTARVVERRPGAVVLDRTAFYATSGGQPHDMGTLGGARVTGVEAEGDAVVHAVDGEVPGGEVRGAVDAARRRDHREQHHGQHLLSRAFIETCGAETVSFHLGDARCTIDLALRDLSGAEAARAEDLANLVVRENRPVETTWHSAAEARTLGLRKLPDGLDRVRVVTVKDFDRCACGGTHPSRTGDVGQIRVLGWEKSKGHVRVTFVCGGRALLDARSRAEALSAAGAALGAGAMQAAAAAARAAEDLKAARRELGEFRERAAAAEAGDLVARTPAVSGRRVVRASFPGRDVPALLALARPLCGARDAVFVLTGQGALVAGRGEDVPLDLAAPFREAAAAAGVRGGGRGQLFQAAGGTDPAALEAAADALARKLAP
ncbi:MAG: alanyl-tRNA editing protein [Planctomycetia bacterium]|nr:alanyl-tRNA editing protein [Planctomycetia bacterium]